MYNEISISDIVNLYLLQPITQTFQNAKHRNELKGSMEEPNISIYFRDVRNGFFKFGSVSVRFW